ncbi:hypothetical protein K474DRAFT_1619039 [Panus rudis PR-1116 ss-1]|nr:hypothetical protein K474DRAFT_1619039 [Panus rudis PR-1116 ss-1]
MDAAVTPPLRIQPYHVQNISASTAQARIANFLQDFQERSSPLSGGDATVPSQLSKLKDALKEEREIRKKLSSS